MAAYEVLLLNTAVPQIQAAQSGDTYVVPRDIAFSTVASFATGAEATPSIVATGDANTGIWFPAADTVAISTGGISRLRLDPSGNLGLGVTPSAWGMAGANKAFQNLGGAIYSLNTQNLVLSQNSFYNGTNDRYVTTDVASKYQQSAGSHIWFNAPSGTANSTTIVSGNEYTIVTAGGNFTAFGAADNNVNTVFTATSSGTASGGAATQTIVFTQAMTLDASGNLLVGGTSNPYAVANRGIVQSNGTSSAMFGLALNSVAAGYWISNGSQMTIGAPAGHPILFDINGERARISSDGTFRVKGAGTAGTTDAFQVAGTAPADAARITSGGDLLVGTTSSSGTADPGFKLLDVGVNATIVTAQSSNAALTTYHLYSTGAGAFRFYVGAGGTVYATNTTISAISDVRHKENIRNIDAGLAEVMQLQPRVFDWKAGKGKDIKNDRGFIAQEFEQVFPNLIDEWKDPAPEGEEPYKSVRQDLIPVLVKAIQEQQAMINELKAEVAALKGA